MANSYFRFKQFTLLHDKCAMKVGTDGVLLGAWAMPPREGRILDIGTGCGLIALMLAQKCNAQITGIEIDLQAVEQARENVQQSPWKNNVEVVHSTLQKFSCKTPHSYDLIISNPPFFSHSLSAPDKNRTNARHQTELTIDTILSEASRLLNPKGCFCLIYPADKEYELLLMASVHHLYPNRIMHVQPTPQHPPKRVLVEFKKKKSTPVVEHLAIEAGARHKYTEEYKKLTQDYYLAF